MPATQTNDQILIRLATTDDAAAVHRLAELDSAEVPGGLVLLAIVGGTPHAAVAVSTGLAVADPFVPTAEIVELLRLRAGRLRVELAAARGARTGRQRLADLVPIRRNSTHRTGGRNAPAPAA
jgi:hypothetical protein